MTKLLEKFADVKSGKVFRGVIWILGEFAHSEQGIVFVFS
jgi:hypothetical protein